MEKFKERDAIYLRKSRMDPESESVNETLARHEDTLMKLAINMGLNITGIYKEVVSGDGLFTRPEMVRLLQDVEHGEYTGVVCMEIDRLGRSSQRDSGMIYETLKDNEVFIITPNKTYDLNNEFDETSVEMQSFIARQELKSIKRRLRKGVEKTCEQGGFIAEPPFGYRRTYIDKRPTLEICEEEAKVVRMIYDMYVNQGIGGYTIANIVNGMGFHPRKNDHFSRNTVKFILENPTYIGKVVWNKERHIKPKFVGDKHKIIPNPKSQWIVADGLHPAIVSQEIFDEAQRIRATRSHPSAQTGELKNPYAGLVFCKNCGFTVQRQYGKRFGSRLMCTNTGCNRSIQTVFLDKYIKKFLTEALSSCRSTVANQVQDETQRKVDSIKNVLLDLQKNLSTLNSQRSSLHDYLERGVYDVPTFMERNKVLSDRITNVNAAIDHEQAKLNELQTLPPVSEAIPLLEQLLSGFDELPAAEKNRLLKSVISKMTYLRDKRHKQGEFELEIEFKYSM